MSINGWGVNCFCMWWQTLRVRDEGIDVYTLIWGNTEQLTFHITVQELSFENDFLKSWENNHGCGWLWVRAIARKSNRSPALALKLLSSQKHLRWSVAYFLWEVECSPSSHARSRWTWASHLLRLDVRGNVSSAECPMILSAHRRRVSPRVTLSSGSGRGSGGPW